MDTHEKRHSFETMSFGDKSGQVRCEYDDEAHSLSFATSDPPSESCPTRFHSWWVRVCTPTTTLVGTTAFALLDAVVHMLEPSMATSMADSSADTSDSTYAQAHGTVVACIFWFFIYGGFRHQFSEVQFTRGDLLSCLQMYLALIIGFAGLYDLMFLFSYSAFSFASMKDSRTMNIKGQHPFQRLVTFVYYSTENQSLVGYGDISPSKWYAQWLAMLQMAVGVVYNAVVIVVVMAVEKQEVESMLASRSNSVTLPGSIQQGIQRGVQGIQHNEQYMAFHNAVKPMQDVMVTAAHMTATVLDTTVKEAGSCCARFLEEPTIMWIRQTSNRYIFLIIVITDIIMFAILYDEINDTWHINNSDSSVRFLVAAIMNIVGFVLLVNNVWQFLRGDQWL